MPRKPKYAQVLNDDLTHMFAELVRLRDLAAKTALAHPVGSPEQEMAYWLWERSVPLVNRTLTALRKRDALRAVKGEK